MKKYPNQRKGLFRVYTKDGKYTMPAGWETEIKPIAISGEDKHHFYFNLDDCIHKSRLVQWIGAQLTLGF